MQPVQQANPPLAAPIDNTHSPVIVWAEEQYGIQRSKVLGTLKLTCFKGSEASDAECVALLIIAKEYGLNPFTREIFAFKDKYKGVVPIVSVDGWAHLLNSHPQFDGCDFEMGPEVDVEHAPYDGKKRKGHQWVKCTMHAKDRKHPVAITEFLDEVYQAPRGESKAPGPWQTHPKRMHRHKAFIQAARTAFGFSGIYDDDEAERILDAGGGVPVPLEPGVEPKVGVHEPAADKSSKLAAELAAKRKVATDALVVVEVVCGGNVIGKYEAEQGAPIPSEWVDAEGVIYAVKEVGEGKLIVVLKAEPPADTSLEERINAAKTMAETTDLLTELMSLPASPERERLTKLWQEKVQSLQAKKADGKPEGVGKDCDELIEKMKKAKSMDALNEASDLSRSYVWRDALRDKLNAAYEENSKRLATARG